ncbi:hypothetical protein JMJ35_002763 [Cladonia borealis]|uniref:BTB domain-containing protein n=1 Tax=Cladonia borealis TaxID=184061 RepID=A0AA39V706_9LECA|nr:hypothetical protein JMJ35_002763 [Cladonia borealis]
MEPSASSSPSPKTSYFGVKHLGNLKLLEGAESATVTVGPKDAAITWHLPKALLTRHSLFFAAALDGSFAEAKLNSVTMPDDDPNVFRLWVQWLYLGHITCQILGVDDINNVLVKAWILGDKLGCQIFKDVVMMDLLACHSPKVERPLIETSTLRTAYEGSAPGSKLRKWALNFFVFEIGQTRSGNFSALQRNILWVSETKDIEDFSQDYMEASVEFSLQGNPTNPYTNGQQYMEVLSFKPR